MTIATQPRHARLFELLRQQYKSEATVRRLGNRRGQVSRGDAMLLQMQAAASFRAPDPAQQPRG